MAIPFAMPSDEEREAALDQLLADLFEILQQIQILRRVNGHNQITSRVRNSASSSRRTREEPGGLPDLVNSLTLSSSINSPADLEAVLPTRNLPTPTLRRRRRTSSESSCCGETKTDDNSINVGATNQQDWIQEQEATRLKVSCRSESLLSKVIPPSFSGSIWTAVICVAVGWLLLHAR